MSLRNLLLVSPRQLFAQFSIDFFLGHPHLERFKAIGHKYSQRWHGSNSTEVTPEPDSERGSRHGKKNCKIQAVRSVCDWSHGVLTEASIQEACQLPFLRFIRSLNICY